LRRGSFTEKRTPVESPDHNGGFLKVSQNSGSEIDDKSSYAGDDIVGAEDFRKELERLQIATIYSLVERVPVKGGREINLLFLTNGQASEFNFTDMDKVLLLIVFCELSAGLILVVRFRLLGDERNGHQAAP